MLFQIWPILLNIIFTFGPSCKSTASTGWHQQNRQSPLTHDPHSQPCRHLAHHEDYIQQDGPNCWCHPVLAVLLYRKQRISLADLKFSQHDTQFTTKIHGFLTFIPHWMLLYFFAGFLKIAPCVWPNSGFWCSVFLTLPITIKWKKQRNLRHWVLSPVWTKKQLSSRLSKMIDSSTLCLLWSGPQEKGQTWWHSVYHQNSWFSYFHPPLNANVLFAGFLNLTLCMTKLRVLVLCFSYFTHNSIKWKKQRNLRRWLLSWVWTKKQQSSPLTKITVSTTLCLLWTVNEPSPEMSMMALRPFGLVVDIN